MSEQLSPAADENLMFTERIDRAKQKLAELRKISTLAEICPPSANVTAALRIIHEQVRALIESIDSLHKNHVADLATLRTGVRAWRHPNEQNKPKNSWDEFLDTLAEAFGERSFLNDRDRNAFIRQHLATLGIHLYIRSITKRHWHPTEEWFTRKLLPHLQAKGLPEAQLHILKEAFGKVLP